MRVYGDETQNADGWNIEYKLELDDDGRFRYYEHWTIYDGVTGVTVEGRWRRDGGDFVFNPVNTHGRAGRWVEGRERRAVERGDVLDFGDGFELRRPEREEVFPVRNDGTRPLPRAKAPGAAAEAAARAVGPTPPPVVPSRAVRFPQFEPRAPSPELAARIRRWVEELPREGMQDWVARLCKENDAIPLHATQIYLWALRADGQVLSIDHESFSQRAERENNAVTAYAALAQGAHDYPELAELLAHKPEGVVECERCGGKGWTEAQTPERGTDSCHWCDGMGWHEPRAPR